MAFDRTNTGTLGKNDDKTDANPTWADYKGQIDIDGTGYWLSGWIKEGQGGKFISLSVKPKGSPQPAERPAPKRNSDVSGRDPDEDIPF